MAVFPCFPPVRAPRPNLAESSIHRGDDLESIHDSERPGHRLILDDKFGNPGDDSGGGDCLYKRFFRMADISMFASLGHARD